MKYNDNKLFFEFFESLSSGAFILDKNGYYLYVNNAYCRITGKTKSFFKGLSVESLKQQSYINHSVYEDVLSLKSTVSVMIHVTDPSTNEDYDLLATATPFFDSKHEIEYIFYIEDRMHNLNMRIQEGIKRHIDTVIYKEEEQDVEFIAHSPQMKNILHIIDAASSANAPILLYGESGTGKEVLANHIHSISTRKDKPFVAINCATIPEPLIESELFGYEKGAFSGAMTSGKKGLLEESDGGTLFLDEINSMPYTMQAKFLRVLENKEFLPIGSTTTKKVDFRLICTSNENMYNLIKEKRFRSDLFYRIDVISITIPPLRERREDIYPLIFHFMDMFCNTYCVTKSLSPEVIEWCMNYDWPGNTRELKNTIEKMIIISPKEELVIQNIPFKNDRNDSIREQTIPAFNNPSPAEPETEKHQPQPLSTLKEYLNSCEKEYLETAYKQYKRPSEMAKILGINVSNIYRKLQKYGINIKN